MSLSYPADDFPPAAATPQGSCARGRSMLGPLIVGAAVAFVSLTGQSKFGAWLRGFFSVPRQRPPRDEALRLTGAGLPLHAIRDRILGRRKAVVVSTLGPPRTAVASSGPISLTNQGAFWHADTWYYPVDAKAQTAMAVTFVDDIAMEVDFFDAPGAPQEEA
jgi:hypothetical protein